MYGKTRVAHAGQNEALRASLEEKRQSLAAISWSLKNGAASKKGDSKVMSNKKKKLTPSDSEFIEKDSFEESDSSLNLSEEIDRSRKRKVCDKPTNLKSNLPLFSENAGTLSESSDDDTWLGKPNSILSMQNKMKTRVSQPKPKRKIILNFSDESDEEASTSVKGSNEHKTKKGFDTDEEFDEPDGGEGDWSSCSDSEDEELGSARTETKKEINCTDFFNNASREELILNAKVSEKVATTIEESRPFPSFGQLEKSLCEIAHGKKALENYLDHIENRDILESVLRDCKVHADTIRECYQQCLESSYQPTILSPGFNLHDYQKIGLHWLIMMYKNKFNCILGDEMGLGKTIQIVAFLAWLKEQNVEGPHLIVVPSSTIENWIGEIKRWCSSLRLMTYYGNQEERKQIRKMVKKKKETIDVILTTYNMISSKQDDKKFFKNFSLNYVIYDEGHMLKNCATDRYKNLMKVKGKRKILLTGTPLQNNLVELISLMYFVMAHVFNKYCEEISQLLVQFKALTPGLDNTNTSLYHRDRIDQAKQILQPYMLRRLKGEVLSLPPKYEEVVEIDMLDFQKDTYDNILESYRNLNDDSGAASAALMRLRQAANHPLLTRLQYTDQILVKIARTLCSKEKSYEKKIADHVAEDLAYMGDFQIHQLCEKFRSTQKFLLNEDLAVQSGKCRELDIKLPQILFKNEKVLIFSQFTTMLDILEVYLKVRGHQFLRLDGSTPVLERQEMINQFNSDKSIYIFLLSTKAGGLGINLVSANHIIIHDIDFNPYNDKQAEDRCHRMGQKNPVFVTRFISRGSVETGMYSLARRKLQLERDVTVGLKLDQNNEDECAEDSNNSEDSKPDANDIQKMLEDAIQHKEIKK